MSMLSPQQRGTRKKFVLIVVAMGLNLTACTYSFTNAQLRPPAGVSSIAIAPIFDSSRRIMPHGRLWESIQKEFVQSGKIMVLPAAQADTYLKAQLVDAQIEVSNERRIGEKRVMPFHEPTAADLNTPQQFEDLKTADRYSLGQTLTLTVRVEVWDLRSKSKLLVNNYSASGRRGTWSEKIPVELRFVRSEEGLDYLFAEVSDVIARKITADFFSSAH